ncbi:3-hydroxyacyl-CoA dehydrogenase family protein [Thioclava pacifica]|uniref:3-hydroxyacyl-CoA dehydrogenase family protein n=1 Tax=Thioclava pacifica TaxID=285109 RepID=UPI00146F9EB5|nr:3-hydroxyacyl-CoA dehydrogenase family protein [Thioclava pacifica]
MRFRTQDGLAWITLSGLDASGAPAGFTSDLRAALGGLLDLVARDHALRGVIVQGDTAGWPVATDPLEDYATDGEAPDLATLAQSLAALDQPVLARLSGRITGGSLALSQAADLRIADPETTFLSPEFALGAIPAAGGLVRLARRKGGAAALDLLTRETPLEATAAMSLGLCELILSDPEPAEIAAALDLLHDEGVPPADAALSDPAAYLAAIEPRRAALRKGPLAEPGARALEVVESALLLPLDEALDFEAVAFEDLSAAPLSKALRHAARCAAQTRSPGSGEPIEPMRIGLWDQPPTLAGALLAAGHSVILGASDPSAIEAGFASIAREQERQVQQGSLDPETRDADWARLGAAMTRDGLEGCDMVIAAGTQPVPETPLLLPVLDRALAGRVGPVLIRSGGIVELVPGTQTTTQELARLEAVLRLGDAPVVIGGPGVGGIVTHLRLAYIAAAERAVLAGATVAQVDEALTQLGVTTPPLRLADAMGISRVCAGLEQIRRAPGPFLGLLALEGHEGRASGQGFYDWSNRAARPIPDQAEALSALRREAGITPRRLGTAQIRARILAELANEGASLLQRAQAHRACDIDLAARFALGLPASLGGVMFAADQAGLLATRKLLRALTEEGAPEPVTLWDVLIRNGKSFADLDRR